MININYNLQCLTTICQVSLHNLIPKQKTEMSRRPAVIWQNLECKILNFSYSFSILITKIYITSTPYVKGLHIEQPTF